MFTRCPFCLKTQSVSPADLREGRGLVTCRRCRSPFDALTSLAVTKEKTGADLPQPETDPWAGKKNRKRWPWRIGALLSLMLFFGQLAYFESDRVLNTPRIRSSVQTLCELLGCNPPYYRNTNELSVLYNSLSQQTDGHYVFKLVVHNDSSFVMPYPNVALTLLSYEGSAFTYRLFQPAEYLDQKSANDNLPAQGTAEIDIKIAPLQTKIGGFRFDLRY